MNFVDCVDGLCKFLKFIDFINVGLVIDGKCLGFVFYEGLEEFYICKEGEDKIKCKGKSFEVLKIKENRE